MSGNPPPEPQAPPACTPRCPACGDSPYRLIYVHGHAQCARCGCNTEPCCQPDTPLDDGPDDPRRADPGDRG